MKIGGVDPLTLPVEEVLVLPRGNTEVILKARAVNDWSDFHALCQPPIMPRKLLPGGKSVDDEHDPNYQQQKSEYYSRQWAFFIIKSLEPSQIEWDTVKMDAPGTWMNWRADLLANNFRNAELGLIEGLAKQANQLDEEKLEKARELFLRGPQPA